MDTRTKIVETVPGEALGWKAVAGYFDPMHAGHVRRLRELCAPGEKIIVFVDDPPNPILPARARAELVAALDCIGYVVPGMADSAEFRSLIDERHSDTERSREFARHVLSRYESQ